VADDSKTIPHTSGSWDGTAAAQSGDMATASAKCRCHRTKSNGEHNRALRSEGQEE